jgi:hypothetical protein
VRFIDVKQRSMARFAGGAAVAMLLHAATAGAQSPVYPEINFNAFGTVGVVHSSEKQADFASSTAVAKGAGHSDDWSVRVDSRLGLQLGADFSSRLSSVVQVVVEQQYDGEFKPGLEWANLDFALTPRWSARVGRMVLPAFMGSGYRKVSYANATARPSAEVYNLVPVTNTDGLELRYRFRARGYTNTLSATYGNKDSRRPEGVEIEARNIITATNTFEGEALSLFIGYTNTRLTLDDLRPLFNSFRAFGAEGAAIAQRYEIEDKRFEVFSLGGRYDPGPWFISGEFARSESRTFLPNSRGWYLTGGMRFGPVTPYITVASVRVSSNTSDPGLAAPQAESLNQTLNRLLGRAAEQDRIALGARWDFMRNAALKMQFDRLDLAAGSRGILINEQPGFERGGAVSVFSLSLDFVY